MTNHNPRVVGAHMLDAAGRAYSDDKLALEDVYTLFKEFVTRPMDPPGPDDVVSIVTDHGVRSHFSARRCLFVSYIRSHDCRGTVRRRLPCFRLDPPRPT